MSPGLRELKKERTRSAIQRAAMELIERQGYDATTCEQIAAAAEVSPATFFRYFPTKEDVVLTDEYDPLIAAAIATRPAREGPLLAVRRGLAQALATIDDTEMAVIRSRTALIMSVPPLRNRMLEGMHQARDSVAHALAERMDRDPSDLEAQTLAAAFTAALSVAVEHWAADGGDLAPIVDKALGALTGR